MKQILHVHVTQEDIDAKGHACFACPQQRAIDRALHDATGNDYRVLVGSTFVTLRAQWRFTTTLLPGDVVQWIHDYDQHFVAEPMSYEFSVEVPECPQ